MSSVSSPPTMTTGRRMCIQRRSRGTGLTIEALFSPPVESGASSDWWLIGSYSVMVWPSTSSAYGRYMSPPSARPMPSAMTVLPFPGGPYRKIAFPALTAGPSWSSTSSSTIRCVKPLRSRSRSM